MSAKLEDLFERVAALRMQEASVDARAEEMAEISAERQMREAIEDAARTGELLHQGLRWASWLSSGMGMIVGFGSVLALTQSTGNTPVNVLWLIAVTMVLPTIAACFALLWTLGVFSGLSSRGGLAMALARSLLTRGIRLSSKAMNRGDPCHKHRLQTAIGAVRGNYEVIRPVMPWTILRIAQRFALMVSVGFLCALVLRLATWDVVFGWSTTIEVISGHMSAVIHTIGAPFGWVAPQFVPDDGFIHATRFYHFRHEFAGGADIARQTGRWWPFLFWGAFVWGVWPRLVLVLWTAWNERREIRGVLARTQTLQEVIERLHDGDKKGLRIERISAEESGDPRETLRRAAAAGRARRDEDIDAAAPREASGTTKVAVFLYWEQDRPVPIHVQNALISGLNLHVEYDACWGNDHDHDTATLRNIAEVRAEVVVVFVEPFANPSAGFKRQIGALRDTLVGGVPIVVSLQWYDENGTRHTASDQQIGLWRDTLTAVGDPALRLMPYPRSSISADPGHV